MAGVRIRIDAQGAGEADRALRRLGDVAANLDDPLREIGEVLLVSHKERFRRGRSPDGVPWEPLSEAYAARKAERRPGRPLLVFDDLLRGALRYDVAGGELRLGTDRPYGARHQFGFEGPDSLGRKIRTPIREWLGLSDEDSIRAIDIVRDYLAEQLG